MSAAEHATLSSVLAKIRVRLRMSLFPTRTDREFIRWIGDDGDARARQEYDLDCHSLVFDCGGYKGQWASDIYARYNCRVLVFEPVKSFAEQIERRFSRNSRIEVFRMALGSAARQESIGLSADGSSVYRKASQRETIRFEDVARFFAEHRIERVDLMKLNIEGGEYELLPRMIEAGLIGRIRNLQIQFHEVTSDSADRMDAIRRDLAQTHDPAYEYRFVWEGWKIRSTETWRPL
jgi:FkbM family methyltransferase